MAGRWQRMGREDGFTLVELLMVIIVLGLLAAIVVFGIGSIRKDAGASACRTDLKSIELSAQAVHTTAGGYPDMVAATSTHMINSKNGSTSGSGSLILSPSKGALLKTWPTSPDYVLQYEFLPSATNPDFKVH